MTRKLLSDTTKQTSQEGLRRLQLYSICIEQWTKFQCQTTD